MLLQWFRHDFHCPFEQCCPFYSLTTSVTISGWLIHLFTFKSSFQNTLSLVLGRNDISFSYFLHFSCFFYFFSSFFFSLLGLKALKPPTTSIPPFSQGCFVARLNHCLLSTCLHQQMDAASSCCPVGSNYIHTKHSSYVQLLALPVWVKMSFWAQVTKAIQFINPFHTRKNPAIYTMSHCWHSESHVELAQHLLRTCDGKRLLLALEGHSCCSEQSQWILFWD